MACSSNTPTNRYGAIAAEMYDLDKPVGSLHDTAFHRDRLTGFAGPILEPACGSGRALIPLLEAGCEVVGFDASAEMLERCRARCAERGLTADLSQQRFEDFHYDRRFAAVFVPAGSFGLIDDFTAAMGVLRRFRDHLTPGGLVVLDVQPVSTLAANGETRRSWTAEGGDLMICETRRMKADWIAQREEHHTIYERWRDNRQVESWLEPMALRYWGVEELAMALREAGFGQIVSFGNYDRRRSPRSGDRVLTFEAVRV